MWRVAVRVLNKTRDSVIGARLMVADKWWTRLRGFIRRPPPEQGEGLLLSPCRGVHMWGVRFPLDVIFVDRHGRVVAIYEQLQPGRWTGYHFKAEYAIEVPAGTVAATQTQLNDLLAWLPINPGLINPGPSNRDSAPAQNAASDAGGVQPFHASGFESKTASQR